MVKKVLIIGGVVFLVGLLLIAFTENWQRLGDMAARTIVIMHGREPSAKESKRD